MIYIMANIDMGYFDLEKTRKEISGQGVAFGMVIGMCNIVQREAKYEGTEKNSIFFRFSS